MHDHNDARVAALQRAVEAERLEDIRRAQRFLQLANKVRAFRDGEGAAPTEAELTEWAEHTAKAAALAERLAELQESPEEAAPISDFADSTGIAATAIPHSRRWPQIEWTETFAYAFVELSTEAGGEIADIQQMRALGANLWLEQGGRDAIEVAQEEFDKRKPR
ncbi:MAG: hypothetical protein V4451_17220 [Pseudomonadota bacterium]